MKSEVLKIGLINMPQAVTMMPSIGLTQLSSVVKKAFGDRVKTDIIYANLDFVEFIGYDDYKKIETNGLTEWMFRGEAFPQAPDNIADVKEYFFAAGKTVLKTKILDMAAAKIQGIGRFLDGLISRYNLLQYDVVGFTSVVRQISASLALARRLKEKKASIIIVIGGASCDFPMGRVLMDKTEGLDYVFAGPAINSFTLFIQRLLNHDIAGTHQIGGVFSKRNKAVSSSHSLRPGGAEADTCFRVNPRGDYHDINQCIELDYDGFLNKFESFSKAIGAGPEIEPVLLFETSIGCWKRDKLPCTFCGFNDPASSYASMRADLAVDYISDLIGKYSNRCSIFSGADCIIDKRYVKNVLPQVKKTAEVILHYECRSNLKKDEMKICAEAGAKILQPGIESLNSSVLKLMQKGVTAFDNIRFLKYSIETGIYPIWNLLYGVPDELDDSGYKKIQKDLPLLRHLPPPSSFGPIVFVRYSQYFEKADRYGLRIKPDARYSLLYPLKEKDLADMVYNFVDTNPDAEYINVFKPYIQGILMEILSWMSRFRNSSNFPKLCFLNDNKIFDSRDDEKGPVNHAISPLEREMIDFLEEPQKFDRIMEKFSNLSEEAINGRLAGLNERGLLFVEGRKYMSLVCSGISWEHSGYLEMNRFISLTTEEAF